jgi:hypothetical protein
MLVLEVFKGDVDFGLLYGCQADAAKGLYAGALASFVQWLAPKITTVQEALPDLVTRHRNSIKSDGLHRRTVSTIADLSVGLDQFLQFALEAKVLSTADVAMRRTEWMSVLLEVAKAQQVHQIAADPVTRFLELLASSLGSGRAHVAGTDGLWPSVNSAAWGWRREANRSVASGNCIGWVSGEDLYLDSQASYQAALQMISPGQEPIHVSERTLHQRLQERNLLVAADTGRGTSTIRKSLNGVRRQVLHLKATTVLDVELTEYASPPCDNANTATGPMPAGPVQILQGGKAA